MSQEVISKELLSEVLEEDKICEIKTEDQVLYYRPTQYNFCESINIHELAHKCKKWALKDWEIHSAIIDNNKASCEIFGLHHQQREFEAETEPEAIFKACEWILENKNNS